VKVFWKHYDGNLDDYAYSQFTSSLKLVKEKLHFGEERGIGPGIVI
jgi:hypothetical protein